MITKYFTSISRIMSVIAIVLFVSGCERDVADLQPASYPTNPEVFIDGFSSGLNYAAFGGSVPTAFDVDKEVTYGNSAASMRFEVPDANDPRGAYAGGVFYTSVGRNLSGYTALTFWAKASQPVTIDVVGLGNDLGASTYQISVPALPMNTNWKKYIIPIPDPGRLSAERGMFYYSVGPVDGKGFTFWIDNMQFEKLTTIAYATPAIFSGETRSVNSFAGISIPVEGISAGFNLPDGTNMQVNLSSSYFTFSSSNEAIATVDSKGLVTIVGGPGTAVITAKMQGVAASGSLTVISEGVYVNAPVPTVNAANVISLFSDAYENVPVDYYNGYWAPYQTTLSADFEANGDHVLQYTDFNFVGIQFSTPTINASTMTHLHMDCYITSALAGGAQFKVQLVDFGADGAYGGGDDSNATVTFTSPTLVGQSWIGFEIPLNNFSGLAGKAHLGQIILEGTGISSFYLDNIYFHK